MKQPKRNAPILAVLILALGFGIQACTRKLSPEPSCNFVQNPQLRRVSWAKTPVQIYLHESVPVEAYAALDRAVLELNSAMGKPMIEIVGRGIGGPLLPGRDQRSVVYWFKKWNDKPSEQARTTIHWVGSKIFEGDIRINGDHFTYNVQGVDSFSSIDLESLALHEFVHLMGMGHKKTENSVMNLTLDNGQSRRDLYDHDIADLKCEYGD